MNRYAWNLQSIAALFAILSALTIFCGFKYASKNLIASQHSTRFIRLSFDLNNNDTYKNDCRHPTIDEFPGDFLTEKQRSQGGIIIHFLITLYLFGSLAIACDDYFVKSLELISNNLKLNQDVSGATFMAAGSSIPELFTTLVGIVVAKSDVGLGTIVGSAVFNVFFILGLCALAAKTAVKLDWYGLARNCFFYSIVIAALIIFMLDGEIRWYEATILLFIYCLYILSMYYNAALENLVKFKIFKGKYEEKGPGTHLIEAVFVDDDEYITSTVKSYTVSIVENNEHYEKPINPFKPPDEMFKKIFWIIFLPTYAIYYLTIPDCRRKIFSRFPYYFITFFLSTTYLALLSYILVWMVVIIADTFQIPDTVAGLTLLAAGTSMPEVVTGIIVTRQGKGDMAVSNSIGSNIFDILVCLGLPWFIQTVFINTNSVVKIYSGGIEYSAMILIITVVGLFLLIALNKFYLTKKLGLMLFLLWIISTVVMCLLELDIFGNFSLPLCKK